jgi:hypothetical protein
MKTYIILTVIFTVLLLLKDIKNEIKSHGTESIIASHVFAWLMAYLLAWPVFVLRDIARDFIFLFKLLK